MTLVCVCSDISPDCFFLRRQILVPIHMFPTFKCVFVATDKPVHVSNNFNNTCFLFCSCIYFKLFCSSKTKPTNPTNSQSDHPLPGKKGLAFYISCIMAWSIGPIEVGEESWCGFTPENWHVPFIKGHVKGKDQGTFVSFRCFKRSPEPCGHWRKHQAPRNHPS